VNLDLKVIDELVVIGKPTDYIRVTPIAYAKTPIGMGYGETRFASPHKRFKLLYIAQGLETGIAETIIRDRFENKSKREIAEEELELWGVTVISARSPLKLIDLRSTGLLKLGVSTNAARGKTQAQGRRLSQAIYELTDADGLIYYSRLTVGQCIALYDRVIPDKITYSAIIPILKDPSLISILRNLNIDVIMR
jgi:hypothetical protein